MGKAVSRAGRCALGTLMPGEDVSVRVHDHRRLAVAILHFQPDSPARSLPSTKLVPEPPSSPLPSPRRALAQALRLARAFPIFQPRRLTSRWMSFTGLNGVSGRRF